MKKKPLRMFVYFVLLAVSCKIAGLMCTFRQLLLQGSQVRLFKCFLLLFKTDYLSDFIHCLVLVKLIFNADNAFLILCIHSDTSTSLPIEGAGGFHTVGFSYEDSNKYTDQKSVNAESEELRFSPPFPVPENLIQNLPPTEKVHQIIGRTAQFVREHGGQSEVVLRVKQGDNPTFGFLMPNHHLHAYFRFLVDHPEHLRANIGSQDVKDITIEQNESCAEGNGALSLLTSLYGTEEDDDCALESAKNSDDKAPEVTDTLQRKVSQGAGKTDLLHVVPAEKDLFKDLPSKEKVPSKRNLNLGAGAVGTSKSAKKASAALSKHFGVGNMEKLQASDVLEMPKPEAIILEPPSDTKKLIDKIVEFVQRNGKEVETVLREQDVKHGRFPFLVASNLYHPYYLKMLQKTQESLPPEKSAPKKDNSAMHGKKTAEPKESDALSTGSAELPFDSNRKEKFSMVLGKSKGQMQASKASEAPSEVGMDTTAIAAILQAATRGAKLSNLKFLSRTSTNGSSQNVDGQASSTNLSWPHNSSQKQDPVSELRKPSVPVAKSIAKTAALAAASEADSLEASMTKEQKLKAERLKRAKMFAAMLKSGGASVKTELLQGNSEERPDSGVSGLFRGLSVDRPEYVERPESGTSALVGEFGVRAEKEREGSSVPPNVETSEETEKFGMKVYDDEDKERRSKRSYRSNSKKDVGTDGKVSAYRNSRHKHSSHGSVEENTDDEDGNEKVEGHSRKKHRSHRYDDENVGKGRSRKKHRYDDENVDVDENDGKAYSRKKHRSHRSTHDSKERQRHSKEYFSKHASHRDRQVHHSSSDDEHHRHKRSKRARKEKQSRADSDDLDEGQNSIRSTDEAKANGCSNYANREASMEQSASSPKQTTTDIPDELRAKVRAMLLANM
ncbi:hypothetical protein QQ045_016457 [Rhodiola kirilowii]